MSIQCAQESSRTSFGSTTPPACTNPTASTTQLANSPSTPPAPLTSPPPLTPPSSHQKTRTRRSRTVLEDIIQEIENRKFGRERSTNP